MKLLLKAPAKLNLTLDILETLPNGYHQVDMLMQTVSIYDEVQMCKANDILLSVNGKVPSGENNTMYKAAIAFFREVGLIAGVEMYVKKEIPSRAGMAGGSADAAAVLVGLNELYQAKLTKGELAEIGALVGADVPFSVIGGTARVRGIGEVVEPLPPLKDCFFVVCMPEYGIRTPDAFARYDNLGAKKHPNNEAAVKAIFNRDLRELAANMGNAIEYAAKGKHTEIIVDILNKQGAIVAQMTGTGAAVFGLFETEETAKIAYEKVKETWDNCFLVAPVSEGAYICETISK